MAENTNDKGTPLFLILAEHIAAVQNNTVKTADELQSLILDIQAHDGTKMDETVASLLIMGAVARKRSIDYSVKTKGSKDLAERLNRYNGWAAANPAQALNPAVNLSMQYAFGTITKPQYDALMVALNGAQSSVKTQQVAVAK